VETHQKLMLFDWSVSKLFNLNLVVSLSTQTLASTQYSRVHDPIYFEFDWML